MKIRRFRAADTPQLIQLFKNTVHRVCRNDYSLEQLSVWAPKQVDSELWTERYEGSFTIVADDGIVVGFSNLEPNGNVDMLYVHADRQGLGIGKLLLQRLEQEAKAQGISRLTSDVSLTARAFFLEMGFTVDREYVKNVRGVEFKNAIMFKAL